MVAYCPSLYNPAQSRPVVQQSSNKDELIPISGLPGLIARPGLPTGHHGTVAIVRGHHGDYLGQDSAVIRDQWGGDRHWWVLSIILESIAFNTITLYMLTSLSAVSRSTKQWNSVISTEMKCNRSLRIND